MLGSWRLTGRIGNQVRGEKGERSKLYSYVYTHTFNDTPRIYTQSGDV